MGVCGHSPVTCMKMSTAKNVCISINTLLIIKYINTLCRENFTVLNFVVLNPWGILWEYSHDASLVRSAMVTLINAGSTHLFAEMFLQFSSKHLAQQDFPCIQCINIPCCMLYEDNYRICCVSYCRTVS